ncbi:MAG: SCO family protein [Betaproteobacteria bacterium]|nr:SCO family protein [Betaproteobacteria bacterium]
MRRGAGFTRWAALVAIVLGMLAAGCSRQAPAVKFRSTDLTGVEWGKDFRLTDQNGKPRDLADFKGKVVLLFFGYTHCPDVCPTTLAKLASARKSLGAQADRVQVLFVTVDPARDTPQRLAEYLGGFDPTFLGLWGDETAIARTAKAFKIYYKAPHGEHDNRSLEAVEHSSGVFAFDPEGKLRLYIESGRSASDIAHDVKLLLSGGQ